MSFLKNFYRQKSLEVKDIETQVGVLRQDGTLQNINFADGTYEYTKYQYLSYAKSAHFFKVMEQLLIKLAYAELSSDYPPEFAAVFQRNQFDPKILAFVQKRSLIYQALREKLQGNSEQDVRDWFQENEKLLANFLKDLDAIYEFRNTSAKIKDICWEIADCLVAALVVACVAALVVHLAGIAIFGGAFAHLVAPATTTAATMIEGAAAGFGVGLVGMGFFKCLNTEKRQITNAIEKDLRATAQANSKTMMTYNA